METRRNEGKTQRKARARTPQGREDECISLAMDLAYEHLVNKTATSQEIVHFLRLGTEKERLERESIRQKIELDRAKTEAYDSAKKQEEMLAEAMAAMSTYMGNRTDEQY